MELSEAIKIFKDIYSTDYEESDKMVAIVLISREWNKVYKRITKADLLNAIDYAMDILGK